MNKYELTAASQRISVEIDGENQWVELHQIRALRDFNDVTAGSCGGWVADGACLSQQGDCWIYAENCLVLAGARIEDNARITGACVIGDGVRIRENAWVDNARLSDGADISGSATVQSSVVRGGCAITDEARVINHSEVDASQGLTADDTQQLRIYQQATVNHSKVVHQAQIYGRAMVVHAFVEHRAAVFDEALVQGNAENSVWICDCAQVYGRARILVGSGEDQCPTLRYSTRVYGNALIEGDCVCKHRVEIYGDATLCGGPILLDEGVSVYGRARISGDVVIENQVTLCDDAQVDGGHGETLHLRGAKTISGTQRVTRTPFYGVF